MSNLRISMRFYTFNAPSHMGIECNITKDFATMQEKKQNISPVKQRILQFADTLEVSKRDFYEEIGVSRGTLEANTGITEGVVAKFLARFPNVSKIWLLTGEGPMLRADAGTPAPMVGQAVPEPPPETPPGAPPEAAIYIGMVEAVLREQIADKNDLIALLKQQITQKDSQIAFLQDELSKKGCLAGAGRYAASVDDI
jgi:hypothetical protein